MWLRYLYLRIAYFLGFKVHVYNHVSGLMANDEKDWMIKVHSEAWAYQETLIASRWFECPHCFWATKKKDEHILKGKGYCYEQSLEPTEVETLNHQMLLDRLGEDPMTWQ
jgi:hypothetical protein